MNACLYYTYAILSHSLSLSLYILNNISNAFYSTALTSIVPCLRVATVMFLREKTSQEFWSSNCQTFISAGNHHLLGRFFFSPTCSFPKKSPLLFFWKFWREKNIHPPLGVFFFFSGENPKIPSYFCVCFFFSGSQKKNWGRCTCGPQSWQQPRNDQRWSGVCSGDGWSYCCCSLAEKFRKAMLLGRFFGFIKIPPWENKQLLPNKNHSELFF